MKKSCAEGIALAPRRERYLLAGLASEEAAFSCFTWDADNRAISRERRIFAEYRNLSELGRAFTLIDANSAD